MTLYLSNYIKKLKQTKDLFNWSNANKILLDVKKAEMEIFKSKQKEFEGDLSIN